MRIKYQEEKDYISNTIIEENNEIIKTINILLIPRKPKDKRKGTKNSGRSKSNKRSWIQIKIN